MKLPTLLTLTAGGLALAACSPSSGSEAGAASCHTADQAALDAKFTEFNNAWATKNPDTVTALFDDDAVLLATVSNTPRKDPAQVRDYFVKFLQNSPVGKIDTTTVKSGCDWALRMGTWTVTLTDPKTGAKNDLKARYTFLYQFEDGQWKIEHLHSSAMPEKL